MTQKVRVKSPSLHHPKNNPREEPNRVRAEGNSCHMMELNNLDTNCVNLGEKRTESLYDPRDSFVANWQHGKQQNPHIPLQHN